MTGYIIAGFLALTAGSCLIAYIVGVRRGNAEIRYQINVNDVLRDENANLRRRLENAIDEKYKEAFGARQTRDLPR